jgi:hypothetical protein
MFFLQTERSLFTLPNPTQSSVLKIPYNLPAYIPMLQERFTRFLLNFSFFSSLHSKDKSLHTFRGSYISFMGESVETDRIEI